MQAIGYIRVSGHDQAENGAGLPIQRKAIETFCRQQGITLVGIAEDAGVSGAVADRPGLVEVEGAIRGRGVQAVVVHRLDRLARELLMQERLLADWTAQGVKLISVSEPDLDEGSPDRKFFRQILGAVAEFDKARIVARLRWGRQAAAKAGKFVGGRVALGFDLVDGELVVNPEEAETVKRVWALRRRGLSYHKIAATMEAEGRPTKRGGKWAAATVRRLLLSAQVRGKISFEGKAVKGHKALVGNGAK